MSHDILVVKFTDGRVVRRTKISNDYGDDAAKQAMAEAMATRIGRLPADIDAWALTDEDNFVPASGKGSSARGDDVVIVDGVVVIDLLAMRKRALKKAVDRATVWLIKRGFEAPVRPLSGTGYDVGDILTASGGTGGDPKTTLEVHKVDGLGVPLLLEIAERGTYTTFPSNPVTLSGGAGSGATATLETDGVQAIGPAHSLSGNAQMTWADLGNSDSALDYPITISDLADENYTAIPSQAAVMPWQHSSVEAVSDYVSEGNEIKLAISNAASGLIATDIFLAASRSTPWGDSPPDFDK